MSLSLFAFDGVLLRFQLPVTEPSDEREKDSDSAEKPESEVQGSIRQESNHRIQQKCHGSFEKRYTRYHRGPVLALDMPVDVFIENGGRG